MRTTITIDDDLLDATKTRASELGRSVSAFIEEAHRFALQRRDRTSGETFELITCGGRGVRPGVDLDKSSELFTAEDAAFYGSSRR